jgi:predicted membrane protein
MKYDNNGINSNISIIWEENMRNKLSNSLWGLFFIVVGLGIAGKVIGLWEFEIWQGGWWTFLIIIPCFISMIQSGFGVGSTLGFIIGVMLFLSYHIDLNFTIWQLIVPAFLIFIGLRIMFQNAFRKNHNFFEKNMDTNGTPGKDFSGTIRAEHSAVFSSNRVHVTDIFGGANINTVFGGVVFDLRDAIIPGDVEVNATAIFGGIDMYLPKGVKIKTNNVPIFGGISNKTEQSTDPGAPTIYLNSTCMFGGIDIK